MYEKVESSGDELLSDELRDAAKAASDDLLSTKSKAVYEAAYKTFTDWKREHRAKSSSETILMAYFQQLSKKYKPSSLWATYSMLKSTININEKTDISTYPLLTVFLKKQSAGFRSKKSSVFTSEEVTKFLTEAPDEVYLATKVALIFGFCGACRSHELVNIKLRDITKQGDLIVVTLPNTKTKIPRNFIISQEFTDIVKKYEALRPKTVMGDRFFVNYQTGKCTKQFIGIHKFSNMPKQIAKFLNLNNPESYTGHAFRRTSATLLADSGANITTLKRHGGWKSSSVAEGYIEDSVENKTKIFKLLTSSINMSSTSTRTHNESEYNSTHHSNTQS